MKHVIENTRTTVRNMNCWTNHVDDHDGERNDSEYSNTKNLFWNDCREKWITHQVNMTLDEKVMLVERVEH